MEAGKKTLPLPKGPRIIRGTEESPVKMFLFGPWGSGKSYSIKALLELGYKVLVTCTDAGGSGLNSVKVALRAEGKAELLENLVEIIIESYEQMDTFISDPARFFPEIYDFDPDFLFWDGFAAWQQVYASEKVGSMPVARRGNQELPEAVEEGLQFEVAQWGMLRNATFRTVSKYCALNNKKTGKLWHKIVTAQESYKSKGEGEGLGETGKPLLQGAGGILMGGAFDIIVRTKEVVGRDDKGKAVSKFVYQIKAGNEMPKSRFIKLAPELPADMGALWAEIKNQLGMK